MTGFIRIVNFEKMQHKDIFKKSDGKPPWIKFFVKTLDNEDLEELDYLSQLAYMKLLLLAARKENSIPNQNEWVARRIGMSAEEVGLAIETLLETGFLSHSRTRRKLRISSELVATELREEERRIEENRDIDIGPVPRYTMDETAILSAWRKNAPPLTAHHDKYVFSDRTRTAMRSALKVYSGEDVTAAVGLYADVLGSEAHYFTHRWSLVDFLKRGLDKFVPEAEPLTNFRRESRTNGLSPLEIANVFEPKEVPGDAIAVRALGRGD